MFSFHRLTAFPDFQKLVNTPSYHEGSTFMEICKNTKQYSIQDVREQAWIKGGGRKRKTGVAEHVYYLQYGQISIGAISDSNIRSRIEAYLVKALII
jgi:hypothetical protein